MSVTACKLQQARSENQSDPPPDRRETSPFRQSFRQSLLAVSERAGPERADEGLEGLGARLAGDGVRDHDGSPIADGLARADVLVQELDLEALLLRLELDDVPDRDDAHHPAPVVDDR
jgi:hypothetical protein